jgi:hypothetical protein
MAQSREGDIIGVGALLVHRGHAEADEALLAARRMTRQPERQQKSRRFVGDGFRKVL